MEDTKSQLSLQRIVHLSPLLAVLLSQIYYCFLSRYFSVLIFFLIWLHHQEFPFSVCRRKLLQNMFSFQNTLNVELVRWKIVTSLVLIDAINTTYKISCSYLKSLFEKCLWFTGTKKLNNWRFTISNQNGLLPVLFCSRVTVRSRSCIHHRNRWLNKMY